MKSMPLLSDKAKDLLKNAFAQNCVEYYDDLDKYVRFLKKCSGDTVSDRNFIKLKFMKPDKDSNPTKYIIEGFHKTLFMSNESSQMICSAFFKMAKNEGIHLVDNFMTLSNKEKWEQIFYLSHKQYNILLKRSVTSYINESIGALDIQKGYFCFSFKYNDQRCKNLLVPLDEYNPEDVRQQSLKKVILQPMNNINILDIVKFIRKHHLEINKHSLDNTIEDLTIFSGKMSSNIQKASKNIHGLDFINMLNNRAGESNNNAKSKLNEIIIDIDENSMFDRILKKMTEKSNEVRAKPSPRGGASAGTITYSRSYTRERNDDD